VICVVYDMVEYQPEMWNPTGDKTIVHIDALPAEVDERYIVATGVLGDIGEALRGIALRTKPHSGSPLKALRRAIVEDRAVYAEDQGFPVKPQKILWDLRECWHRRHRISDGCAQDVDGTQLPCGIPEHLHHLQRLRGDGHRRPRCYRRQAGLSRAQSRGRDR
jgi:thiamine pyrophosphate-dependent acetolactate synthase large subunit-like protein